ncbi:MAG: ATP-binding protein [Alphaproteobacteria bacterium]|jgi:PAS domain S-box-containing protein
MKKKLFLSLNIKILLVMLVVFAGISTLFLSTFMMSYTAQIDRESVINRKKAERIWEMFQENTQLRRILKAEHLKGFSSEIISEIGSFQDIEKLLEDDERFLSMRQELLQDIKGARERERQMEVLGYFIFLAFSLVFLSLIILWFVMRRWILSPVEDLLEATNEIAKGNLEARVPISVKRSKDDELDLLARDFNKMADSISEFVCQIEESRQFLQNLIDTIPDGVRVIDEDFNIVQTNRSYEKMYMKTAPACGRKCYMVSHGLMNPCTSEQNPCPMLLLKEHPEKPVKVIQRYLDADNRERYVEVTSAALPQQKNGHSVLWIIELIRSLDKEIIFSHRQKLSSVGMLASSVAHEMRNPLGSVRLILENILERMDRKPLPPDEMKRYLQLIYDQMSYCIDVTSRLLKLSRKPEREASAVDFNEVVAETSSLLEYEAKKRGVEVLLETSSAPAVVSASDAELRMVTVNLMQNALHAMSEGGTLTIRVEADSRQVRVLFSDTGCGIPAENLHRIFEPFFSQKKDENSKGTGLGLSITKTIVENYGGKIVVESVPGNGTTFTLEFSAMEMETGRPEKRDRKEEEP